MREIQINSFPETGVNYCMAIIDKLGCDPILNFDPERFMQEAKQVTILRNPQDAMLYAVSRHYIKQSKLKQFEITDEASILDLFETYYAQYKRFMTAPIDVDKVLSREFETLMTQPEVLARDIAQFFGLTVEEDTYKNITVEALYEPLEAHIEGTGNHLKNVGRHIASFKALPKNLLDEEQVIRDKFLADSDMAAKMAELNTLYASRKASTIK